MKIKRKRSIQNQTHYFLLFLVLATLGIITVMLKTLLFDNLVLIEDKYAAKQAVRVTKALTTGFENYEKKAADWAGWDDTYAFVSEPGDAYITSNLTPSTFENLNIDMMAIANLSGDFVIARAYDDETKNLEPVYGGLKAGLDAWGLLDAAGAQTGSSGVIKLDEGTLIFAAHPVLRSDLSGPPNGTLVIGKMIDDAYIAALSEELGVSVEITALDGEADKRFEEPLRTGQIRIEKQNRETQTVYMVFRYESGSPFPALGIAFSEPRDFWNLATRSTHIFLVIAALMSMLLIFSITMFLRRRVLDRIVETGRNVEKIGENRINAAELPADTNGDEISKVNNAIKAMLENLESSRSDLKLSEEKYRTLVEQGRDIVFAIDYAGLISYISPNCSEILGCAAGELTGSPLADLLHPDDRPVWEQRLKNDAGTGCAAETYEFTVRIHDGTYQWFRLSITEPENFKEDVFVIGLLYNIHKEKIARQALLDSHNELETRVALRTKDLHEEIALRKLAQERIETLAYYDALTGLPNRHQLYNNLEQALDLARRNKKTFGILYMDIDGFKSVNDTLGHQQGDELLKMLAAKLKSILRRSDTIARMGGDEFVIIAQNLDETKQIQKIIDKIIQMSSDPMEIENQAIHISFSIGVAMFPADGETGADLMKNADIAMYRAKEQGKNQYVFCSDEIKQMIVENMKISNEMYRALRNNEFEVYYQPQVSVGTGKITGLEALLRWNHPEKGLVLPGTFIHLAEQSGLINLIGTWVLQNVCRQNKAWQEQGLPIVRVAVNLSAVQFQSSAILDQVKKILASEQLPSRYLEIEITESIVMKDIEFVNVILRDMKDIGLYISIDDFGTKYSSLSYLKDLPIKRLKIPMSFVHGIHQDVKNEAIIKAIIVIAMNMGLDIIAEGVETKEQEAFLLEQGCDNMQGYYYYKPMTAEKIQELLSSQPGTGAAPDSGDDETTGE